jgi:hypothetical protein
MGWNDLMGRIKAGQIFSRDMRKERQVCVYREKRLWSQEPPQGLFGPSGVNVDAISSGPTRTPGTAVMGEGLDQLAKVLTAGRPASPAEIAEAAVYLASDEANFVHGATLPVDGGRLAI